MRDIKVKMKWTSNHKDFSCSAGVCTCVFSAHLRLIWNRYFLPLPEMGSVSFGQFPIATVANFDRLNNLNTTNFLSYSSGGQKLGVAPVSPKWGAQSVFLRRFQGRVSFCAYLRCQQNFVLCGHRTEVPNRGCWLSLSREPFPASRSHHSALAQRRLSASSKADKAIEFLSRCLSLLLPHLLLLRTHVITLGPLG